MLMMKERRPAIRTLRGWTISVLQEAGAICECEEHGWMQDRAGPYARDCALAAARQDPPFGVSSDEAVAEVKDVLNSIGDTCPECPPDCFLGRLHVGAIGMSCRSSAYRRAALAQNNFTTIRSD